MWAAATLCSPGCKPMKICSDMQTFQCVLHIDFKTDAHIMNSPSRRWSMQGMKCKSFRAWYCINLQGCKNRDKHTVCKQTKQTTSQFLFLQRIYIWALLLPHMHMQVNESPFQVLSIISIPWTSRDCRALTAWHEGLRGQMKCTL